MANNNKKYVSLSKLSTFLDNLKTTFATKVHAHKVSDLTDYTVDTELSSTSANPVQNKVLDAEFDAISEAMNAMDLAIDGKANVTHAHTISDVTNLQTTLDSKADSSHNHSISNVENLQTSLDAKVPTSRTVNGKALTSDITLSASDVSALPTSGVDLDFSVYTAWTDVLDALPLGSVTTLRKTKINSALLPSDCPNSDYGNIVIRKVNSVYQNCSATLYIRAQGASHIFEATFSQGAGSVVWMKVADASHSHDDRYYTETEVDDKLASKASVIIREW